MKKENKYKRDLQLISAYRVYFQRKCKAVREIRLHTNGKLNIKELFSFKLRDLQLYSQRLLRGGK